MGSGALSGAHIRCLVLRVGQGVGAASQHHCLMTANPSRKAESGTTPARLGEGSFAPGVTAALCLGQASLTGAVAAVWLSAVLEVREEPALL